MVRCVIQRVSRAAVHVSASNNLVQPGTPFTSSIGPGICVLVGIAESDTIKDIEDAANKLLNVRLWDGANNLLPDAASTVVVDQATTAEASSQNQRWNHSVLTCGKEVLLVSQFTLCHTMKGNKPDFRRAMSATRANELFTHMVQFMRSAYRAYVESTIPKGDHTNTALLASVDERIQTGMFRAVMSVEIINDGPVTLIIDYPKKE